MGLQSPGAPLKGPIVLEAIPEEISTIISSYSVGVHAALSTSTLQSPFCDTTKEFVVVVVCKTPPKYHL